VDNAYPALKRWATLGKALRACCLVEPASTVSSAALLTHASSQEQDTDRARHALGMR